ncbi:MAG: AAA family ATPase [Pseudomonadota bacterium]
MPLILLIGPPAVGKMTVGQEVEKLLGFKLFHNHVTIEMVVPYFGYDTQKGRSLVEKLRSAFFDAFASDSDGGYIFTYVWAFGEPGERRYIEELADKFSANEHAIYWVELGADLEVRMQRNRTENRLTQKPTKRDIEWSDKYVREADEKYRLNSVDGEMPYENYLRIDNTDLAAAEVALRIASHFDLKPSKLA